MDAFISLQKGTAKYSSYIRKPNGRNDIMALQRIIDPADQKNYRRDIKAFTNQKAAENYLYNQRLKYWSDGWR